MHCTGYNIVKTYIAVCFFPDFPCPWSRLRIWSRETGPAVQSHSHVSLLMLHNQAESGADLRDSSRFPRRDPFIIYLNRHMTSGQSRVLSGHATTTTTIIAYRWRSLRRVRWHRASSSRGSSIPRCAAYAGIAMVQFLCASLSPHPLLSVQRQRTSPAQNSRQP